MLPRISPIELNRIRLPVLSRRSLTGKYKYHKHFVIINQVRVANLFFIFLMVTSKNSIISEKFLENSSFSQKSSRFLRISRSLIANSLVWTSYLRKVGSKLASSATKMTHITPPEVTEIDSEVAVATIAALI